MTDNQISLLLAALWLLCLAGAIREHRIARRFLTCAIKATGIVIAPGVHQGKGGTRLYTLRYSYEYPAGTPRTGSSYSASGGGTGRSEGETLAIRIDPTTGESRIDSWSELHGRRALLWVIVGAGFLGGIGYLFFNLPPPPAP